MNANWTVREAPNGVYHVMPGDGPGHRLFDCWCRPRFEARKLALSPVLLHRDQHGRVAGSSREVRPWHQRRSAR